MLSQGKVVCNYAKNNPGVFLYLSYGVLTSVFTLKTVNILDRTVLDRGEVVKDVLLTGGPY